LGLTLRCLTYFDWIFSTRWEWDRGSVFYMWLFSFSKTIYWRDCLFSRERIWHLCGAYTWDFFSIPLMYVSAFVPVPWCFCYYSLYSLKPDSVIRCSFCSGLLWPFVFFYASGDEQNWGTLCTYIEMSQWHTLYNYYMLIKTFFKKTTLGYWISHAVLTILTSNIIQFPQILRFRLALSQINLSFYSLPYLSFLDKHLSFARHCMG
jgi:hypothetical protein